MKRELSRLRRDKLRCEPHMNSFPFMLAITTTTSATVPPATPPISDEQLIHRIMNSFRNRAASHNSDEWFATVTQNISYDLSMLRHPIDVEDAPQHTPQLMHIFLQRVLSVARFVLSHPYEGKLRTSSQAAARAAQLRVGSIGIDLTQQAFYWRVAASPAIKHICEVGFNAGHSAALWLTANPTAELDTFDLFDDAMTGFMTPNLHLLESIFPGRITAHKGNSLETIPRQILSRPCDLVHIDGRHSYGNTVRDTLNFMHKARPSALYLFDDQCDVSNCSGPNAGVAAEPAAATCDLVEAGILTPVASVMQNARPFALFRGQGTAPAVEAIRGTPLPCKRCQIHVMQRVERLVRTEQAKMRPPRCAP